MARVNGYALAGLGAGLLLFWSGFTGKGVLATVQSVIQGKSPQDNPPVNYPQDVQGATGPASGTNAPGYQPPATGLGGDPAANQALGKMLAATMSTNGIPWSYDPYWSALVALWTRESGWSNTADTRQTGLDSPDAAVFAYGIAQARPYSKMPKSAWPPDKGGQSDASAQITWGLIYIQQTYGDPVAAEAHENANGWYLWQDTRAGMSAAS